MQLFHMVIVWLILNECISILENIDKIGVPVPDFLMSLVKRLKSNTEQKWSAGATCPRAPSFR